MKFGIVGVGRWGRTLADKFAKHGAEVVAHARLSNRLEEPDLGARRHWRDIVESQNVDFVVVAGPPEVTKDVFLACAAAGKAVFATKPLMIAPNEVPELKTAAYVDYIHLSSPVFEKLKKAVHEHGAEAAWVNFSGQGPDRSFPGIFDYGPHAIAMLADVFPGKEIEVRRVSGIYSRAGREMVQAELNIGGVFALLVTGNDASVPTRQICVRMRGGTEMTYREEGSAGVMEIDRKVTSRSSGHDPLGIMIDRFLWDAEAGRANRYFVELSETATEVLTKIRRLAGLGP